MLQAQIEELKKKGFPLAYVGDVVGTGSSRKSATNSVLWYMGDDIPYVPNKRGGGICIGGAYVQSLWSLARSMLSYWRCVGGPPVSPRASAR
jgi:aconitase B